MGYDNSRLLMVVLMHADLLIIIHNTEELLLIFKRMEIGVKKNIKTAQLQVRIYLWK